MVNYNHMHIARLPRYKDW